MSLRFYETMTAWLRAGKRVAVVSIVETVGSTPRKPGTKMLVSEGLELYGTIGGGCVEADAIHAAREVMRTLRPKLLTVDITSKNADEIDMLCGGKITFYVEPAVSEIQLLICGGRTHRESTRARLQRSGFFPDRFGRSSAIRQ